MPYASDVVALRTVRPAPTSSRLLVAVAFLTVHGAAGCGIRELPPPAAPPRTVPVVAELPETPPPEGMGRLIIASEGEPTKVARVTETVEGNAADTHVTPHALEFTLPASGTTGHARRTELLCIAPCAVDLRVGAQSLVFTSIRDPQRTSTADVAVPRGTTVVRHQLGIERSYSVPYFAGVMSAFGGAGLTVMGSLALTVGLTATPTIDEQGNKSDGKDFVVFGGILGGVGLAALVTGIVLMTQNRPEKGPGATTTFRVP